MTHSLAALEEGGYRMGPRVNEHCPYDEATLRVDLERLGYHVCPCCYHAFRPLPSTPTPNRSE